MSHEVPKAAGWPLPILFCDEGCPFAHRVRALLLHLGVEGEFHEAPPHQRPEGLTRWSPSGRVPFLVHGEVRIGESRVMLEHLAEAYNFAAAYPEALAARTAARHLMAVVDEVVAKAFLDGSAPREPRLAELLDVSEAFARAVPPEPSLATFHAAPLWLALQRWRPEGVVTEALRARSELRGWLDAAASLDAVARTAPRPALAAGAQ